MHVSRAKTNLPIIICILINPPESLLRGEGCSERGRGTGTKGRGFIGHIDLKRLGQAIPRGVQEMWGENSYSARRSS